MAPAPGPAPATAAAALAGAPPLAAAATLARQLAQPLVRFLQAGAPGGVLRVELQPRHLGAVSLRIIAPAPVPGRAPGRLRIEVLVQQHVAHAALLQDRSGLHAALAAAGLGAQPHDLVLQHAPHAAFSAAAMDHGGNAHASPTDSAAGQGLSQAGLAGQDQAGQGQAGHGQDGRDTAGQRRGGQRHPGQSAPQDDSIAHGLGQMAAIGPPLAAGAAPPARHDGRQMPAPAWPRAPMPAARMHWRHRPIDLTA